MRPTEDIKALIRDLQDTTGADMDERILRDVLCEMDESRKPSAISGPRAWRIIMKTRIAKLAAAAAIIIVVLVGIYQPGGPIDVTTPTFADVVRPLLTAQSGTFKMTIDVVSSGLDWIDCGDEPVQTIEVMFAGPSRTRWNVPTGEVLVANMEEGKVMILVPAKNQASVMQVGPPGVLPRHNRFNKLLELRRLIQYALEREDDSVELLGVREINGVNAVGYYVPASAPDHGDITIWADLQSKLPVQIEQSVGSETGVISDIRYNVELEDSLFGVEPPEEYSSGAPEQGTAASEQDKEPPFVVRGTVTDAATGETIEGAKVADDGYGPRPYKGAITDSEGRYRYRTWPEEHRIKAQAPGYRTQRKGITGLFHRETEDGQVIDFALERE